MFKKLVEHLSSLTDISVMRGAIRVMFLRVCGVVFLFAITVFLTNFYDAQVVGAYEFARSSLFLIGGFVLLGTDQSILFFSGRFAKKEHIKALFGIYIKMIKLLLLVSVFLLGIALLIPETVYDAFFNDTTSGYILLKVAFSLFFYALTLLNTEFFRGFSLQEKSELYRGIFKQLPFALGLFLLILFKNQKYVVEVFLVSFVILAFISSAEVLKIYRSFNHSHKTKLDVSYKTILKTTFPIAISSLGFYLLISIDVLFLKIYTDFETLAYYGTTIKIIFLIATVVSTISSFLAVQIADLFVKSRQQLQELVKKGARIIAGLSAILSLGLFIFSSQILSVFGASYTLADDALRILIVGHFLSTLCGITAVYLNMTKKQVALQYILIFTVVLNVILNWVLIPKMGMKGAAIASAVSVILWNVISVIFVYKRDKIILFVH